MAPVVLTESKRASLMEKFEVLVQSPVQDQVEFFLKSFIFALDDWKVVAKLGDQFDRYVRDGGEGRTDLNVVQASDFLQKHGITRTASQRTSELRDIDLNNDQRISFTEYALLHFKIMILNEFYKRVGTNPLEDLTGNGVGLIGVGDKLLDELFTVPVGLDPELLKAIEEFTAMKKARADRLKELEAKVLLGGVKGLAAKNEIAQMECQDQTAMNRLELTLNAAKRRQGKNSGELALQKKKQQEEEERKAKLQEGRNRLAARAALWNKENVSN